ncbi:MAG TPA: hypothetical protein VEC76_06825 [Streptosporangiaceae bacterium]|nr:hypothetical protein [Streptosporangiaceae bacterium]
MDEQGNYRPRGQAGSGQVSLRALETAFGAAQQGPGHGNEPNHDDAHVSQPDVSDSRPGPDRPVPPWPAVAATTVRLWLGRRKAALDRDSRHRWVETMTVLAVTVLVMAGVAVAFLRHVGTESAARQQAAHAGVLTGPMGQSSGAAAGHLAAAWVAGQVSHDAIVGCDPGMCRLLQARGFPAGNLFALRPGGGGLRFCNVVVATQAVRDLLGAQLQRGSAPAVIAAFGSGQARIEVHAVAPAGAAAYRAALAADWAARRVAAADLVKSPRIHAGGAARQELLTGQVDSRVLITLASLAVSHPVTVVSFGDSGPGASAGVPLREVDIAGTGSPADRAAELQRIRSLVLAQPAVFQPAHVSLVRRAGGVAALRIEFGAPSPLGLLLGHPVTQ